MVLAAAATVAEVVVVNDDRLNVHSACCKRVGWSKYPRRTAAAGQHAAILFENPLSGREEGCQRTEEPRNRQAVWSVPPLLLGLACHGDDVYQTTIWKFQLARVLQHPRVTKRKHAVARPWTTVMCNVRGRQGPGWLALSTSLHLQVLPVGSESGPGACRELVPGNWPPGLAPSSSWVTCILSLYSHEVYLHWP